MSGASKVWVVEEGNYSSRQVVGVFDNEDLANIFAKAHDGEVSEWELNQHQKEIREGLMPWWVSFDEAGNVHAASHSGWGSAASTIRHRSHSSTSDLIYCTGILARDCNHAIKIASERRMQFLAEEEVHIK